LTILNDPRTVMIIIIIIIHSIFQLEFSFDVVSIALIICVVVKLDKSGSLVIDSLCLCVYASPGVNDSHFCSNYIVVAMRTSVQVCL